MGVISGHQIIIETKRMMETAISNGQSPVFFHMNQVTLGVVDHQIRSLPENQPSKAQELLNVFRKKKDGQITHLHGVPIQDNPHLPDGVVSLQVGFSREVPHLSPGAIAQTMQNREENPFVKRERADPSEVPDVVTSEALAQTDSGRVSASDVIMKAMDGIEDVETVLVVRIHQRRGGEQPIDICGNVSSQYEMEGILARTIQHLRMRGQ